MSTHGNSALAQAVELAKPVLVAGEIARVKELPAVESLVARGEHLKKNLFGIEESMKAGLEERITTLECLRELFAVSPDAGVKYRRISFEPLTWRDAQGYPRLAVFNLRSPNFELSATYSGGWNDGYTQINPALPDAIEKCYQDVQRLLLDKAEVKYRVAYRKATVTLSARFSGFIPDTVRSEIVSARQVFGDDIFVVAEPEGGFKLQTVVEQKRDPLVVGLYRNTLWLIAAFDTTTLEEAMAVGPIARN